MTGALLAVGVSHRTAELAVRERLALPEGRAASVLREIVRHDEIHEAVAISTCNRAEVYMVVGDPVEAESAALSCLSRQAPIRPTELVSAIYSLRDLDAARHLFEVAAGLDSMIVGEAEVQGQVKRAYELALVEGVTGPVMNRLFRDALAAGKRARPEEGGGGGGGGAGEARLGAGPGGGRARSGHEPPLPRRARGRQAGPHGDRDQPLADVGVGRRRRARADHARRPARAHCTG